MKINNLWSKIDRTDSCWNWKACTQKGYGLISVDGKSKRAHRVVYELLVGKIPDGMCLDHLCRNRSCVNPSHLEVVSFIENVMRGESAHARNARKTHCKFGHEFSEENTYIHPIRGNRHCRICQNRIKLEYRQRIKLG